MTALLETKGIWQRFGGLVANSDVSISVGRGEIVGLIGPNGAGKSTCFNTINGQLAPDSGTIRFDGMDVDLVGGKFNLTDVAARVGLGQLEHLASFNARRRSLARAYFAGFEKSGIAELGLELPRADFENSNWHMFQVVLPEERLAVKRAQVMAEMHAAGIGTGVHYPAIHLFALYQRLGFKAGDFPHAEYVGRNILTLPLFPAMQDGDVDRVIETLNRILRAHARRPEAARLPQNATDAR